MQNPFELADFQKLGEKYRGNPIFLHMLMQTENEHADEEPIVDHVTEYEELKKEEFFRVPQNLVTLSTVYSKVDFNEYFNVGPEQIQINEGVFEKLMEIENESEALSSDDHDDSEAIPHTKGEFSSEEELSTAIPEKMEDFQSFKHENKSDLEETKEEFNDFVSWLSSLSKNTGEQARTSIEEKHPSESSHVQVEKSSTVEIIEAKADRNRAHREEPASEPLAELLYSQGYKSESIKMYELLMLRIPKKSTIFADRIKEIKVSKK